MFVKSSVIPISSWVFPRVTVRGASLPYLSFSMVTMLSTNCGLMYKIFQSFTCHRIVHWFRLIVLFESHLTLGYYTNSHLSSCLLRSSQNNKAACSVPYKVFCSRTYMTGLPFSLVMYSVYYFQCTSRLYAAVIVWGYQSCPCMKAFSRSSMSFPYLFRSAPRRKHMPDKHL